LGWNGEGEQGRARTAQAPLITTRSLLFFRDKQKNEQAALLNEKLTALAAGKLGIAAQTSSVTTGTATMK